MSSGTIDFEMERLRHGQLFGRQDVIERLHSWLAGEQKLHRGWVLLLGGPGVGKSAIVSRLLDRLGESRRVPYHFIRRGNEGWDRPEVVVQNLCAQIEQTYHEQANASLPSEARLGDLLKRVSRNHLGPRLVLVIDGLDEAAAGGDGQNPLPLFLPPVLPGGVVILCSSRPMHPHQSWLDQRDCVRRLDLDSGDWSASNVAACRAFWAHHAPGFSPPLDERFVEEAVRRSGGNLLYATRLRDWLEDQPPERRAATNIPDGIAGFLAQIWTDVNRLDGIRRTLVIAGLGLACAAREALPVYLFEEMIEGARAGAGEEFLAATRPFLLEEASEGRDRAYRLHHEHYREFIIRRLGGRKIREHHRRIAAVLAQWPLDQRDSERRLYALRHAVAHRIEAGDVEEALRLVTDAGYLEAKCRELGVAAVERDLEAAIHAACSEMALDLTGILAAITAESARLSAHPDSFAALLYNRLRCTGWPAERIERVLRFESGPPPLRLLHGVRLGPTLLRTFPGHDKPVVACVATPDGRAMLSASLDRTLRLWSLATGECLGELHGHQDELTSCAITPDSAVALSTSADATVRLWDLATRTGIAVLDNDGRWATACAVSPDGGCFVVGSDDGTLTVWDRSSLKRIAALTGHRDYVTACLLAPGGRLVSASRDRTVRVWDLATGVCLYTMYPVGEAPAEGKEDLGWITALSLWPGGQVVAAAGDGGLSRWALDSGHCVQRLAAAQGRVDVCAALRDGGTLVCGMGDGTISVWDLVAEKHLSRIEAHRGAVSTCAVTPDGMRLISASTEPADRALQLWEIGALDGVAVPDAHAGPITACALTPDGSIAVSASEDRTLKIWNVATGACLSTLAGHPDLVTACAVSADGRRVVSGGRDGSVRLWALGGHPADSLDAHLEPVIGCAFTPEGAVITASRDGSRRIHTAIARERHAPLAIQGAPILSVAITPDGKHALSLSQGGMAMIWSVPSGRCVDAVVTAHLLAGALTPDAKRLVLSFQDGRVEVRETGRRQVLHVLCERGARVFGCAVSADGARVITASEDRTLAVWSLATGHCLGRLHGTSRFRCVAAASERICGGDEEGNLWLCADASAPRGPRKPPPDRQQLARLRGTLARLYGDPGLARIVAVDAGLDERRLLWSGVAVVIWGTLIDEAVKQDRIDALIQRALDGYFYDPDLQDIAAARGLVEH